MPEQLRLACIRYSWIVRPPNGATRGRLCTVNSVTLNRTPSMRICLLAALVPPAASCSRRRLVLAQRHRLLSAATFHCCLWMQWTLVVRVFTYVVFLESVCHWVCCCSARIRQGRANERTTARLKNMDCREPQSWAVTLMRTRRARERGRSWPMRHRERKV